jgi:YVTN family beta-propeller protein
MQLQTSYKILQLLLICTYFIQHSLYRMQLLLHGMSFSPDHHTTVSIGSNSIALIDTVNNVVKHITYVGRSPHEAFFTPDGKEVWVTLRGQNYVSVLDGATHQEKSRIIVPEDFFF